MRRDTAILRAAFGVALTAGLFAAAGGARAHEDHPYKIDAAKLVGPVACGECHRAELDAWRATRHATGPMKLARNPNALKMAAAMGLARIKAPGLCLDCHFTLDAAGGKVAGVPLAGISCESCHGAGKDWIKPHSRYLMKEATSAIVPPQRLQGTYVESAAAGLIGPADLYAIAANCYGCHSVGHEELVNVAGHSLGTGFELVSWSQGEVRHNLMFGGGNRPASAARKRMLYIVGKAVDLEFALRAVAAAVAESGQGGDHYHFGRGMARRARAAIGELKRIAARIAAPEIDAMLAAAGVAELRLNNREALLAAAGRVARAARALARNHYGGAFAAIDPLIPPAGRYKGAASR